MDWLKTAQKAFRRTSFAILTRLLRLAGGFFSPGYFGLLLGLVVLQLPRRRLLLVTPYD